MAEFLLEIFCEEIPARMQKRAGDDLRKMLTEGLGKAGLSLDDIHHWAGPRRLGFKVEIPLKSPDVSEERKGPRVGAPEQALGGFMKAAGLTDISQAEIRDDKKGQFYVAKIEKAGRASADIIAELIPDIMNSFPWPKSMKTGAESFRWVRPLQSLICLLDGKVVPVEAGGVTAGNQTEGHRQHGRGPFTVKSYADYKEKLEGNGHVLLDMVTRKAVIAEDARALCRKAGLELVEDEGLLNEVSGLAEWPVVILGDMDPSFLELPAEVIRLSMRDHQKYFAVRDPKTGKLAANFIVVANQMAPDGGEAIAAGNSRVLSARLADAQFFQQEDAKKNLIDYYDKLGTVVFHKKLGSIKDKAQRMSALARELAPKVGAKPEQAELAAKLAKCDLVTQTVIEFTSLQGQIGSLMYEREGGDAEIVQAIEEHYKPQGPSDTVPDKPVAITVALADKIDTLVGFWAIDEKPTGSKDPYALRRAALGLVRLILDNNLQLDLSQELLKGWAILEMENIGDQGSGRLSDGVISGDEQATLANLVSFIIDRLKVHLRDKGVRHDLIDAVFALGEDNLVNIVARVEALQSFLSTKNGENLLAGYKRAANILKAEAKKGELPKGAPNGGTSGEEANLLAALGKAEDKIDKALGDKAYAKAMAALADLREPIDAFFDGVMVNSDEEKERQNRLRLLSKIRDTSGRIADFEAIEG
ncbi:MAG: glycine--tRNA ligase subunit beta [Hellea sp.]|nr:glycine--tRNA ligase subunit beta [Hellea sp.]